MLNPSKIYSKFIAKRLFIVTNNMFMDGLDIL